MSDAPQMVTVRCEKHGLRYNPNLHSGCVRCRKEAGEVIGPPAPSPTRAAAAAAAAGGESVIPALAVAALLVIATGSGFYFVHRQVYDTFGAFLNEESFGEETYGDEELEFPDEMELTPEEREQLERMRDEMAKRMREGSGG